MAKDEDTGITNGDMLATGMVALGLGASALAWNKRAAIRGLSGVRLAETFAKTIGYNFGKPSAYLKGRYLWNTVDEAVKPQLRRELNRFFQGEMAYLGGPDFHAYSRDFLDQWRGLSPEEMRAAEQELAGWRDAEPVGRSSEFVADYRERRAKLIREQNEVRKTHKMETLDERASELHPQKHNLDATRWPTALGEYTTWVLNIPQAFTGLGKGMLDIKLGEKIGRSLEQTLYFDGEMVRSRTGKMPAFLESQPGTRRILDATSEADLEARIAEDAERISQSVRKMPGGFLKKQNTDVTMDGELGDIERQLPYIEGAHDATLFDYMDDLDNIRRTTDVLAAMEGDPSGRMDALAMGDDGKRYDHQDPAIDLQLAMDILLGQDKKGPTNPIGRLMAMSKGVSSKIALQMGLSPAAKNVGQLAVANLTMPNPGAAADAFAGLWSGRLKTDPNPKKSAMGLWERWHKVNEGQDVIDRQAGFQMMMDDINSGGISEGMLMHFSDDQIDRMLWLGKNDPTNPELEWFSRAYSLRRMEATGSSPVPTSAPSMFRGDIAGSMGQFMGTMTTSLASQAAMYTKTGMGKATVMNKVKAAIGVALQGAVQAAIASSPAAKAGAHLASGGLLPAAAVGMRAIQGDKTQSEARTEDALNFLAAVAKKFASGKADMDDADQLVKASVAVGAMMVPLKTGDPVATALSMANRIDQKLGYGAVKGQGSPGIASMIAELGDFTGPLGIVAKATSEAFDPPEYLGGQLGGYYLTGPRSRVPYFKDVPESMWPSWRPKWDAQINRKEVGGEPTMDEISATKLLQYMTGAGKKVNIPKGQ